MGYGHQLELIGQIDLIKEAKKKKKNILKKIFLKKLKKILKYEYKNNP